MMMKKGPGPPAAVVWCVKVQVHSLLFVQPVEYGPWAFSERAGADRFLHRLFGPPLVAWARRRLLEWPEGCVDPPDKERLALLSDYRMLVQLHDFYRAEKERTGFNYWTWDIQRAPLDGCEQRADHFLAHMGQEFSDFQ